LSELEINSTSVCLFCRAKGPFSTVEHITPESLGNDSDVLRNIVCDRCQNYLGHSVEKPALDSTPFGFWRTILGTKTKTGALPSFSSRPPSSGAFRSEHPLTDHFQLTANKDASTTLKITETLSSLITEQSQLKIVLSPWHIFTMGRFLGKLGLEYLALSRPDVVMSPALDNIRNYVRRGGVGWLWPVYIGKSGELNDLRAATSSSKGDLEIETECYRYSLGEHIDGVMSSHSASVLNYLLSIFLARFLVDFRKILLRA
jgi:hypothetical protein